MAVFLRPKSESGVRRIQYPQGEEVRATYAAFEAPGARADLGQWPSKPCIGAYDASRQHRRTRAATTHPMG
jgi:hypothetical protein